MNRKNSYRIVRDCALGFEVQFKRWWYPFCWDECDCNGRSLNTWATVEEAEAFALQHATVGNGYLVKNLGKLP